MYDTFPIPLVMDAVVVPRFVLVFVNAGNVPFAMRSLVQTIRRTGLLLLLRNLAAHALGMTCKLY